MFSNLIRRLEWREETRETMSGLAYSESNKRRLDRNLRVEIWEKRERVTKRKRTSKKKNSEYSSWIFRIFRRELFSFQLPYCDDSSSSNRHPIFRGVGGDSQRATTWTLVRVDRFNNAKSCFLVGLWSIPVENVLFATLFSSQKTK